MDFEAAGDGDYKAAAMWSELEMFNGDGSWEFKDGV